MSRNTEAQLLSLCECLRPAMSLSSVDRAEPVGESLAIYAYDRHRVGPLLHLACKSENGPTASAKAAPILKLSYQKNSHLSSRQKTTEEKIIYLLHNNSIPFHFLKGLGLAKQLHDDPIVRISHDIDILVSPEHARKTLEIFSNEGYIYKPHTLRRKQIFENSRKNLEMRLHKDVKFIDPDFPIQIELHQRLFKFEPENLTGDFIKSLEDGLNPSLSSSFYCLYLILHGSITLWKRLKWVVDLSIIARNMPIPNRMEMMDISASYGCEKAVAASLFMTEKLFPGSLDKGWHELLSRFLQDDDVDEMKQIFYENLMDATGKSVSMPLKSLILSGSARLVFREKIDVFHSLILRWSTSLSMRI